eukprot:SAG11_NODE_3530_length_2389_cov_6.609170_2_plen_282_part_00
MISRTPSKAAHAWEPTHSRPPRISPQRARQHAASRRVGARPPQQARFELGEPAAASPAQLFELLLSNHAEAQGAGSRARAAPAYAAKQAGQRRPAQASAGQCSRRSKHDRPITPLSSVRAVSVRRAVGGVPHQARRHRGRDRAMGARRRVRRPRLWLAGGLPHLSRAWAAPRLRLGCAWSVLRALSCARAAAAWWQARVGASVDVALAGEGSADRPFHGAPNCTPPTRLGLPWRISEGRRERGAGTLRLCVVAWAEHPHWVPPTSQAATVVGERLRQGPGR